MATSVQDLSGGLTAEHELFFEKQPDDPEMRESTSIWLFDDAGDFGCPRIGIEGEAWSWDDRSYQANFGLGGGRIMVDVGRGAVPSPLGPDGRPTRFGAGPLLFECIEPFRKWRVAFDGSAVDGRTAQQIAGTFDENARAPLRLEAELTMVTPGWVHDYPADKVAQMSETDAADAASMGIGWRIEHMFRAEGILTVDGRARDFKATGARVKRQSVRPMRAFRGHVWQSALFPDGRAFGYITYPPAEDGRTFNDGYVFQDGRMHRARVVKAPWLRRLMVEGDDATVELESDLGTTRIEGSTTFSTFSLLPMADGDRFSLQQTGVRYRWDGQAAFGMMERSTIGQQIEAES
jgi:hypothetical protein